MAEPHQPVKRGTLTGAQRLNDRRTSRLRPRRSLARTPSTWRPALRLPTRIFTLDLAFELRLMTRPSRLTRTERIRVPLAALALMRTVNALRPTRI